jgi:methionyl-tRNA formyltransferase
MRIIFMGTPAFAVPTLIKLHESGYTIPAVITAPDKLGGRGKKEWLISAVKEAAIELNIPVLQPTNLKSESFLHTINNLKPDLFVVVAFRMLPEVVWSLPPLGTINLHASLLPDYRGAAPINWALINGETTTGVTTFFIRKDIDTGPIIQTKSIEILPEDNAGTLHDHLMLYGANLVVDSLKKILDPHFVSVPQNERSNKMAPKLQHETGRLDLSKSTSEVINLIRGLSPFPGAWLPSKLGEIKILGAHVVESKIDFLDKCYFSDDKTFIYLRTGDHYISLDKIQIPGKKPIDVKSYLNGNKANSWF